MSYKLVCRQLVPWFAFMVARDISLYRITNFIKKIYFHIPFLYLKKLKGHNFTSHFRFGYFTYEAALNRWLLLIVWTARHERRVLQGPPFLTILDVFFLGCVPLCWILYMFCFDCPFFRFIILTCISRASYFMDMLVLNLFLSWTLYSQPSFVSGFSRSSLALTISCSLILFFPLWHLNRPISFGHVYHLL